MDTVSVEGDEEGWWTVRTVIPTWGTLEARFQLPLQIGILKRYLWREISVAGQFVRNSVDICTYTYLNIPTWNMNKVSVVGDEGGDEAYVLCTYIPTWGTLVLQVGKLTMYLCRKINEAGHRTYLCWQSQLREVRFNTGWKMNKISDEGDQRGLWAVSNVYPLTCSTLPLPVGKWTRYSWRQMSVAGETHMLYLHRECAYAYATTTGKTLNYVSVEGDECGWWTVRTV